MANTPFSFDSHIKTLDSSLNTLPLKEKSKRPEQSEMRFDSTVAKMYCRVTHQVLSGVLLVWDKHGGLQGQDSQALMSHLPLQEGRG